MFNNLREKFKEQFGQRDNSNLQDAFSFTREAMASEPDEPEFTPRVDVALEEQGRRDIQEGPGLVRQWLDKFKLRREEKLNQRDFEEDLYKEGVFNDDDMSRFRPGVKSKAERYTLDVPEGVAEDLHEKFISTIYRSGIALVNYSSGKLAQGINEIRGDNYYDEDTGSLLKNSLDYVEQTNPEHAVAYREFLGIKEDSNEVNLDTVGKEWTELINMIPGVDIKENSKMIPVIGFIGSMLDVMPGSSGGKNTLKQVIKKAKNVDEVLLALKGVAKGTPEEMTKFAQKLFEARGAGTPNIMKLIEAEDASQSTINFLKDGKKIETNIKKATQEQTNKLLDDAVDEAVPNNASGFDVPEGANRFHGTSQEIKEVGDGFDFYNNENIYGQGFYTSDAVDVAESYTKKGKGGSKNLYSVTEKPGVKIYDAESKIDDELLDKVNNMLGTDYSNSYSIIDIYDDLRDASASGEYTRDTVQDFIGSINDIISSRGFDGISHTGGKLTGGKAHNVKIYFNPKKSVTITKLSEATQAVPNNASGFDNLTDNQEALRKVGYTDEQLDSVGNAYMMIEDNLNKLDDLTGLPQSVDDMIKETKSVFNVKRLTSLPLNEQYNILKYVKENKKLILEAKKARPNINEIIKNIFSGIDNGEELMDIKAVADDFYTQQARYEASVIKDIDGGSIESIGEAIDKLAPLGTLQGRALQSKNTVNKFLSGMSKVDQRLFNAYKAFKKQGMTNSEINTIFKNGFEKLGVNKSTVKPEDVANIFQEHHVGNFSDFFEMFRYNNMLSGVATHAVNLTSSITENLVKNPAIRGIEGIFDFIKTGNTDSIKGIGKYYKALFYGKNIEKARKKFVKIFNGLEDFDGKDLPPIPNKIKMFGVTLSTKAFSFVGRALNGMDGFMRELISSALFDEKMIKNGYLKNSNGQIVDKNGIVQSGVEFNKLRNSTVKEAKDEARDNIFLRSSDKSKNETIDYATDFFADLINGADKLSNTALKAVSNDKIDLHILKWMVPFVNTISRLSAKQIKSIPVLGMADLITNKNTSKILATQIYGTIMMFAGMKLYKHKRESWKLGRGDKQATSTTYSDNEGNAYDSVKIGEHWHELEGTGTSFAPMLLGARVQQAIDEGRFDMDDKELVDATSDFIGVALNLMKDELISALDHKFMQSALDIPSVLRGDKNPATQFSQISRQFIPFSSFLGSLNRAFFDNEKKVTPQDLKEAIAYLQKDIPGLSQNLTQKTDPQGIPLFYGKEDKSVDQGLIEMFSPTRPKFRDEDIHAKYEKAKFKEDVRNSTKELTGENERTKTDDRNIIDAIDAMETTGTITQKQADLINSLSDEVYEDYRKDWFKEEHSDILRIYTKMKETGTITQEEHNKINSISDGLYQEVEKTYYKDIEAVDLLILKKMFETNKLSQKEVDRLNSLDDGYYNYLINKLNKSKASSDRSFNKKESLYQ